MANIPQECVAILELHQTSAIHELHVVLSSTEVR